MVPPPATNPTSFDAAVRDPPPLLPHPRHTSGTPASCLVRAHPRGSRSVRTPPYVASFQHDERPPQGARQMTPQDPLKARDTALQGALAQIERQFGKGTVMRMGDEGALVKVEAIPTGALSLDLALGIGGMPRGRIVEVYGPESSGKTTLVYHVIAEAQKLGGVCAFIDAEHAMDPLDARNLGVNNYDLPVSRPAHEGQAAGVPA